MSEPESFAVQGHATAPLLLFIKCPERHKLATAMGNPDDKVLLLVNERELPPPGQYRQVLGTGRIRLLVSHEARDPDVLFGDVDFTCVRCWKVCRTTAETLRRRIATRKPGRTFTVPFLGAS